MEKIRNWYTVNQDAISWFIIGALTLQGINELAARDYTMAAVDLGLAAVNYYLIRVRLK